MSYPFSTEGEPDLEEELWQESVVYIRDDIVLIADVRRRIKGHAIAHVLGNVRRIAGGRFVVMSQKSQDVAYEVDADHTICTCRDFEIHRKPCKHILAVEIFLGREGESCYQ